MPSVDITQGSSKEEQGDSFPTVYSLSEFGARACIQLWYPGFKKDVEDVLWVQRKAPKPVQELEKLPDGETCAADHREDSGYST